MFTDILQFVLFLIVLILIFLGFIFVITTFNMWEEGLTHKKIRIIKRVVNDYIELNVSSPKLNSESKKHFKNAVNVQREKLISFLKYVERSNVSRSQDGESVSNIKVSNPHKREVLRMYLHLLDLKYEENKESIEIHLRPKNIFCEDEEGLI